MKKPPKKVKLLKPKFAVASFEKWLVKNKRMKFMASNICQCPVAKYLSTLVPKGVIAFVGPSTILLTNGGHEKGFKGSKEQEYFINTFDRQVREYGAKATATTALKILRGELPA